MFLRRFLALILLCSFAGSAQAAITWDSTPTSGDGGTNLEIIRKDSDVDLTGQYIGINAVGTEPNLYLKAIMDGMGGTAGFTLDATEAAVHFVGGTSGSFTGYWYVNFPSTGDGKFKVEAWNGDPDAGGTWISTSPEYDITSVDADQGALANKIDRVIINGTEVHPSAGTASIQIGQEFDVVAEYLVNSSNKTENLRVDMAASEGFDPDNTRLLGTEVTTFVDTGFTTPIATRFDQLYFKPTDPSMSAVRATFTFVTIGNAAVNLSPIVAAHSGQYKYNADFNDYNINIAAPTNQVTLSKGVVGATYANPGPGTFNYAVTFDNPTAVPVTVDKIFDVMPSSPANGTYVASSVLFGGGASSEPTQSGQTLTFPGPFTIPAFSSTTALTYQLTMPDVDGAYANSATASINGNIIDTSADMNSLDPATATVVIGPNADLQITKTDGLTTIEQGNVLEYTMTVSNPSGPTIATNVIVTDAVAAEFTSPEYSLDGGTDYFPWSGSLDIGTVPVGGSTTLLLRGTVDGAFTGVTTNTASVSTAGLADPIPANNTASDETTVTALVGTAILGVAKQATISPSNSLEVTLDFYLTNHGTLALTDLSVPDDLDAVFGAGNYTVTAPQMIPVDPGTITVNPAFNGSGANTDMLVPASSSLASGASAHFKIVVLITTLSDQGYGLGLYRNQVTASALDPLSAVVTDLSDSGALTDADGDGDPTESIANGGDSDENEVTVFAASELAGSPLEMNLTKSVVDLNGGDVGPGDTLRYTLNVDNALTTQVTNLTVTDNLPAGLESYTLIASPAGSSAVFTPAPGGTNGNGVLDVTNLTIAANTGVEIIFETVVGASVANGAVINNIADLDYPAGANDSDNAQVTVVAPILPASGIKPLYMTDIGLSRTPLLADVPFDLVGRNGGNRQWLLSPATTDTLTLAAGTIPVKLWLSGDKAGNFPITVSLSSTGGTVTAIGAPVLQTLTLLRNDPGPSQYQFDIVVPSDVTLAPNSQIVLKMVNDFNFGLQVTPRLSGIHTQIEPFSTTVIRVDSVDTLDAAYPLGTSQGIFYANGTMYVRTVVADPFGQADISDALLELKDSSGATVIGPVSMGAPVTNDAGTRTYEYAYTFAGPGVVDTGTWSALVTGVEGTEGTVTHSAILEFAVGDVQSDYGDAPDALAGSAVGDYRTRLADDGPRHDMTTDVWLGASVDADVDGFGDGVDAGGDASDDDLDAVDDEDGITFSTINSPGLNASVSVLAFNGTASPAYLNAWIDFDGNGIFNGVEEQIATDLLVASGTVSVNYTVPAAAPLGTTYARFRYSAQTGLGPIGAAATGEVEDYQITIEVPGYSISGRVFEDPNVNGLFDAGDTGIAEVGIVLRDVLGATCVTTRTDGDGNYTFSPVLNSDYILYESVSASVPEPGSCPPTSVDPSGYLSVTANEIVFSLAGADITGQNFADVRTPVLTTDNSTTGNRGSSVVYPHTFTTRADGSVDFSVAATPVTTDWSTILYRDANCDAQLDSSDPVINGSVAVTADDSVCLLVKVFIAGDAASGEQHVSTLTASYTFADPLTLGHGLTSIRQRNDVTTATAPELGKLILGKSVENIDEAGAKSTANAADIGDVLRYTVAFENTGAGLISDLKINDATPGFTSTQTAIACPPTLPASLSSCVVDVPVALDNVIGYEGLIQWSFGGTLAPGAKGELWFDVIVE